MQWQLGPFPDTYTHRGVLVIVQGRRGLRLGLGVENTGRGRGRIRGRGRVRVRARFRVRVRPYNSPRSQRVRVRS